MRYLEGRLTLERHAQRVVAHRAHRSPPALSSERAIGGCGQQCIWHDLVTPTIDGDSIGKLRGCEVATATEEHTGRLDGHAALVCPLTEELKHLGRLHDLVRVRDHTERSACVIAEQHDLVVHCVEIRGQRVSLKVGCGVAHTTTLDGVVHVGSFLPLLNGLADRHELTQAMPLTLSGCIGDGCTRDGIELMSHDLLP